MVRSLCANPLTQAIGAIVGVGSSIIAVRHGHVDLLRPLAVMLGASAVLRTITNLTLRMVISETSENSPRWSRAAQAAYELAALLYASVIGAFAAASVAGRAPPEIQVLAVGLAIGFGIGIAARSAGRPLIAIGQTVLALLPVSIAMLLRGDPVSLATAGFLLLTIPATCTTVTQIFRLLRKSIESAETSARFAENMQQLARTDVVTGLNNRAGLDHALIGRVAALEPDQQLALSGSTSTASSTSTTPWDTRWATAYCNPPASD